MDQTGSRSNQVGKQTENAYTEFNRENDQSPGVALFTGAKRWRSVKRTANRDHHQFEQYDPRDQGGDQYTNQKSARGEEISEPNQNVHR